MHQSLRQIDQPIDRVTFIPHYDSSFIAHARIHRLKLTQQEQMLGSNQSSIILKQGFILMSFIVTGRYKLCTCVPDGRVLLALFSLLCTPCYKLKHLSIWILHSVYLVSSLLQAQDLQQHTSTKLLLHVNTVLLTPEAHSKEFISACRLTCSNHNFVDNKITQEMPKLFNEIILAFKCIPMSSFKNCPDRF